MILRFVCCISIRMSVALSVTKMFPFLVSWLKSCHSEFLNGRGLAMACTSSTSLATILRSAADLPLPLSPSTRTGVLIFFLPHQVSCCTTCKVCPRHWRCQHFFAAFDRCTAFHNRGTRDSDSFLGSYTVLRELAAVHQCSSRSVRQRYARVHT